MFTRFVEKEGKVMFIILSVLIMSGLFIYMLLSPPLTKERSVRITRGAPANEQNYKLSIMSLKEEQHSHE
ncbi:hypothetical protein DFP97_1339 [Paenibacillus prosopidis]|uniref:Uncharacterized protein n=1 Tax=Paenibacillus prosopidis TaxID=630520 RepID=A0A368VIQ4_9BACL|nr:hypothetical protein DFP97_1339 [Paenibacillus prosopidis]